MTSFFLSAPFVFLSHFISLLYAPPPVLPFISLLFPFVDISPSLLSYAAVSPFLSFPLHFTLLPLYFLFFSISSFLSFFHLFCLLLFPYPFSFSLLPLSPSFFIFPAFLYSSIFNLFSPHTFLIITVSKIRKVVIEIHGKLLPKSYKVVFHFN